MASHVVDRLKQRILLLVWQRHERLEMHLLDALPERKTFLLVIRLLRWLDKQRDFLHRYVISKARRHHHFAENLFDLSGDVDNHALILSIASLVSPFFAFRAKLILEKLNLSLKAFLHESMGTHLLLGCPCLINL